MPHDSPTLEISLRLPRRGIERLDLLLLSVEALDLNGGEAMVWMSEQLGFTDRFPNRVELWKSRCHNPLRRTTRRGAVRVHTRTRPRRMRCGSGPLRSLRYAPRMLSEDFHSGDDVTLGFLGRTYGFVRSDFEQRVLRAAVELELVRRPLSRAERDDLVAAAIDGRLEAPRSEAGERIAELQARGGEDPVYWLRKLVFRSAWLDHRIKEGAIDIAYDDAAGAFRIEPGRYPLPGSGHPSFAATEAAA